MHSASSIVSDPSLDGLPAWKRDLILRRRANQAGGAMRTSTSPSSVAGVHRSLHTSSASHELCGSAIPGSNHNVQLATEWSVGGPQYSSVGGPKKQLVEGSVGGPGILELSAVDENISSPRDSGGRGVRELSSRPTYNASGDECIKSVLKSVGDKMHQKSEHPPSRGVENNEVDLEYGPGIVSKLKNRYMSLAMRDARARPALRRFSSLEDLLDAEDSAPSPRGRSTATSSSSEKREAMKRARSVDCLTAARNRLGTGVPYGRQEVEIMEEKQEVVTSPVKLKSIKSVFEPPGGGVPKGLVRSSPTGARPSPVGSRASPTTQKPLPKAKPAGLLARRPDSISEAKVGLKQVSPVVKSNGTVSGPDTPLRSGTHAPKSLRSPLSPVRSQKSIESTRVLLENRKNVQKSLKDVTPLKVSEVLNPKPVLLVESEASPRPVALPLKNAAAVSVPPAPKRTTSAPLPPKSSPTQQTPSPVSPLPSTPSKQILSPITPCHTSTPNHNSPNKERINHETPMQSPVVMPRISSSHKSSAPSPPNLSPSKTPTPTSTKKAPPPPEILRPSTRPPSPPSTKAPSPPLQRNHFVSLKPTSPRTTPPSSTESSPTKSLQTKERRATPPAGVARGPATTKVTSFSSTGDEVTQVIEAVNLKTSAPKAKDRWHQDSSSNSLVFNFVGAKSTPDYIENDGVDISKKINKNSLDSGYVKLPGYDDCDSSTDDWDELTPAPLRAGDPPPPCPFSFVGDAVVIKGRSNLQRQPRSKKLSISFNDTLTKTFEYPSEASLIEDPDEPQDGLPSSQGTTSSGLATYTPSKLALGDAFELGVSRTVVPLPPSGKRPPPEGEEGGEKGEEYLRPAGDEETVAWSAGGSADMLF